MPSGTPGRTHAVATMQKHKPGLSVSVCVSVYAGQKVSLFDTCNNVHCSHINQKTQFENPVLEAKKRLNQETAIQQAAAAAAAATSATTTVAPSQGDAHTYCTKTFCSCGYIDPRWFYGYCVSSTVF